MPTQTSLLPEREYIAILSTAMTLTDMKRSQSHTPGDFDGEAYVLQMVEKLAEQRMSPAPVQEASPAPVETPDVEPEQEAE